MDAQQERAGDSHVMHIVPAPPPASARELVQLEAVCPTIISEVSSMTRRVQPQVYTPQHVSVGPYHRTWYPNLARDEEKEECVRAVLESESTKEACLDELARLEDLARGCNGHTFEEMDSTHFARMLLLDGCSLLACFKLGGVDNGGSDGVPVANGNVQEPQDHNGAPSVQATAGYDLMKDVAVVRDACFLAENQIPIFVVAKIHELAVSNGGASTAANPIVGYAKALLKSHRTQVANPALDGASRPGNLLHLLHMHLKPTVTVPIAPTGGIVPDKPVGRWWRAAEYASAGVNFKSVRLGIDDGVHCILDVKLCHGGGTLEILCLHIDDGTCRLLRNLMALEQQNPEAAGKHVTAYCIFMSKLACKEEDVELLSRRGIIIHGLGCPSNVAVFFTNLCSGIMFEPNNPDSDYLRMINLELEKRFRSRLRRWVAWLDRRYFSNPWVTVGLIAAALGLACAMVQAVYSVLSYSRGKC